MARLTVTTDVIDPMCGMNISAGTAIYISRHNGKNYCFCSLECCKKFEKKPEKYLSTEPKLRVKNKGLIGNYINRKAKTVKEVADMNPRERVCYDKGRYRGFVMGALVGVWAGIAALLIGYSINFW